MDTLEGTYEFAEIVHPLSESEIERLFREALRKQNEEYWAAFIAEYNNRPHKRAARWLRWLLFGQEKKQNEVPS